MFALSAIESDHGNSFRGKLHEQVLKRAPTLAQLEAGTLIARSVLDRIR